MMSFAAMAQERRRFDPPADFAAQATLTESAYADAAADRLGFWEQQAERIDWDTRWDRVLDWDNPPFAKWFVGGRLNARAGTESAFQRPAGIMRRHLSRCAGKTEKLVANPARLSGPRRTLRPGRRATADQP
jgi:hypothetical protein